MIFPLAWSNNQPLSIKHSDKKTQEVIYRKDATYFFHYLPYGCILKRLPKFDSSRRNNPLIRKPVTCDEQNLMGTKSIMCLTLASGFEYDQAH